MIGSGTFRPGFGKIPTGTGWALWRTARCLLGLIGGLTIALLMALMLAESALGPPPLEAADDTSAIVVDRDNRLLRAFTTKLGRWRLPIDETQVDPRYIAMLLAYEDKYFYQHRGFDPVAATRILKQLVTSGGIRSGASTITMQVARLLEGRHDRTGSGKLKQIVRAMQLEERLSKAEILRIYLEIAPFGGNLEGVRAASLAYFGKEPVRLSIGEAALLVALPQAPGLRRPDLYPDAARKARDVVLDRMLEHGVLNRAEIDHARTERVPTARRPFPQLAAHLAESEIAAVPDKIIHRLSLHAGLQSKLEALASEHAGKLGPRLSVAILALDHTTGEVLAHVGSAGYLDETRFGAIDMARAIRSPGSTLKPFVYGLGFETGLIHPRTLIEDKPARFGAYVPKNFDNEFHGTVSIAEALQKSLNIPAVKVLSEVGPTRLLNRMKGAGAHVELPEDTVPSLAVALGGIGLTLEDLAALYAGLARGGEAIAVTNYPIDTDALRRPLAAARLLDPIAAWYTASILRGTAPPRNAKGGQIAYKTGTSYGYRDAWAVGFDGRTTIAVWVGRPDAVSTAGLTGISAAAPILFDAFARLDGQRAPFAKAPDGALVPDGAPLPPPLRIFRTDRPLDDIGEPYAAPPVAIAFPPDKAELNLAESSSGASQPIVLKADGGVLPLTWLVDGAPIASVPHRRDAAFVPAGRGIHTVAVIDAAGSVDRVSISLH